MKENIIASKDNPNIKLLRKLQQKKYRQSEMLFVVENAVIIADAARQGHLFESLFITEGFNEKNPSLCEELAELCPEASFYRIPDKLNGHFSSLETPSGIAAIYRINENSLALASPTVYLNAIGDPGNLGTIIRSMAAFGFRNLVVDERCADLYNPKTIQAAKDAIFKVNIGKDEELAWLKANAGKLPLYASVVAEGEDLDSFAKDKEFCLILGSESHGVSEGILELANRKITIGMSGKIESLNVAIAAGILFYKLRK